MERRKTSELGSKTFYEECLKSAVTFLRTKNISLCVVMKTQRLNEFTLSFGFFNIIQKIVIVPHVLWTLKTEVERVREVY